MFDTHCHLQELADDADAAVARAQAAGVGRMLLAGVGPDAWQRDDALAVQRDALWLSYGLHPQLVATLDDAACDQIVHALAKRRRRRDRPRRRG